MARDWCFTDFDTVTELDFEKDKIRYICYGVERCPDTDREHFQGFVIFNRTCRIPKCKQWLGGRNGCHVEPRRGTRQDARDYCRKGDGRFYEWGEFEAMTKEQLFKKNKEWLLSNGYEEFFCRYHRAICEKQDKGEKWRPVKVTWIWGKPGTGKTRMVMEKDSVYKWDSPYSWFDGYGGERILLIDDYETGEIPARVLKNLLDGYQYKLNIKGGHTYAKWNEVYITSNYNIKDMPEWSIKGIERRIHEVVTM